MESRHISVWINRSANAGPDWCEVVFTLRRRGVSDAEYDADGKAVAADLAALKRRMESRD